jgi:hypothetical protein
LEQTSKYQSASEDQKEKLRQEVIEKTKDSLEIRIGNEVGNILQQMLENKDYKIIRTRKVDSDDF